MPFLPCQADRTSSPSTPAGATEPADQTVLTEVLSHWEVDDTARLREHVLGLEDRDRDEAKRVYGGRHPGSPPAPTPLPWPTELCVA